MEIISKNHIIVVNPADHAALVAAAVMLKLLSAHSYRVEMVSLTDPIPKDESAFYTFVGCGEYSSFKRYYEGNAVLIPWMKWIYNNATFITSDKETDRLYADSYFGKLQTHVVEQYEIPESVASQAFLRYFSVSESWLSEKMEKDEVFWYSALLGRIVSALEGFTELDLFGTTAGPLQAEASMRIFNRTAANRCKTIQLRDRKYRYFSTSGLATLWLIRRVYLIKQNFIHASMGEMGMIIYSNNNVDVDHMKDVKLNLRARVGGMNLD